MSATHLVEQSIAAMRNGEKPRAAELLAQALLLDPNHEQAWLWLSGIVTTDAERRFCLERVRAINPENPAAARGLTQLPSDVPAQPPSSAHSGDQEATSCTFPGCSDPVARKGHTLCLAHWRAINRPPMRAAPVVPQPAPPPVRATPVVPQPAPPPMGAAPVVPQPAPPAASTLLSATGIAERLALQDRSINFVLTELGWLTKAQQGWKATPQGAALGAVQKYNTQSGTPYVLWPEAILSNALLRRAIERSSGESQEPTAASEKGFREKFPARHRATDGHFVRSKAEQLIDNWLYMAGIVHAYERQLPIEEDVYCDFYIPAGKVYIEYWGMEQDQSYAARQQAKREIYRKYRLNLIELTDDHVRNLDDVLPKLLLKFGVAVSM